MRHLLVRGMSGTDVSDAKQRLAQALGPVDAELFAGLGKDTGFDADTEAAARRWQSGVGLTADGVLGPRCLYLLGQRERVTIDAPDLSVVRVLFPQTKPSNIVRFLPYVTCALEVCDLVDRPLVLAALGTIRAETAGFVPIGEYPSQFNTVAGQAPFSAYEPGTHAGALLGNSKVGDGAWFKGRGFVQLTGRDNYVRYGDKLGVDLVANPELANAPEVAALLLGEFLADHADALRTALALRPEPDYKAARRLVNGGSHGLQEFRSVFVAAAAAWPPLAPAPAGAASAARGTRKARPVAAQRDAHKDPVDLRDRAYAPPPVLLPDVFPPDQSVRDKFDGYRTLVLDQGNEGACTGFGLACVINFALWQKSGWKRGLTSVSPQMLFNYARRYDEYAGEDYDYSSCRGAIKGWFNHGVCMEDDWPKGGHPRYGYIDRAARTSLGVYYRIETQSIVDMQVAIMQTHAIFVSAFTHPGWEAQMRSVEQRKRLSHDTLPVISFDGQALRTGGHAFALVGFNAKGFVVQNSWGPAWGLGGFAVLSYADWLANGMDAWVASLGVSGVTQGLLASSASSAGAAARAGASRSGWWDEATAYAHSPVFGDDGRVTRYVHEDELSRSLQHQACTMPDTWFRSDPVAASSDIKRLVIYAHGGLNSEADAIKRARAMGPCFTGNGCYPLFLVWKTGILESIGDILSSGPSLPAGAAGGIAALTDPLIEKTLGRGPVRRIWSEMKQNAEFSCSPSRGADLLAAALTGLSAIWGDKLEIHLVGHSAGSILLGHLLDLLSQRKLDEHIASVHLYAPACTVAFANRHYAPHQRLLQRTWLHILSDEREKGDNTAYIYRKSLLYLVSNSAEPDVRTPLLGLFNARDASYTGWDGSSSTGEALSNWRAAVEASNLESRTHVVSESQVKTRDSNGSVDFTPAAHGSFDNDVDIVGVTLERITGATLRVPVEDLRGF